MAITRLLDPNGAVVHDCAQAGCQVSWDGVALSNLDYPAQTLADGTPTQPLRVAAGEFVPGASGSLPAHVRQVDDHTVQLLSREETARL